MPWDVAIPMMISGGNLPSIHTISSNAEDYNLFTAVGSPVAPIDLYVTLNSGITIDTMLASGFAAGTKIYFTVLGTIRGRGGAGGAGGDAEGGGGGPVAGDGDPGFAGGDAFFSSSGVDLYLDMDAGNVWGGGGGGGGGGGWANFPENEDQAGSGGGGGQGWNASAGGAAGVGAFNSGFVGAAGGPSAPGSGGGAQGDGGAWGIQGQAGETPLVPINAVGTGGLGGAAGRGIHITGGGSISITGWKSQPTLIAEGRLLGGVLVS